LSASWGVDWRADGKAVWFELAEDSAEVTAEGGS
jgi:hypothetical protein